MSTDPQGPAGTPGETTTSTRPLGSYDTGATGVDRESGGQNRPDVGVMTPYGRPGVYIYPFWQRSEFWAFLVTALGIGIAAAADDAFGARSAWLFITILASAYIVSRGLAKKEPREDDGDQPWTPGGGAGRFSRRDYR
jgi:hypothetical protein